MKKFFFAVILSSAFLSLFSSVNACNAVSQDSEVRVPLSSMISRDK